MALRTYWCVLSRKKTTVVKGRTVFDQVDQFSCELDLDQGMGYTLRAALFHGVRQYAGDDADASEYRMDVYGEPGNDHAALPAFTVPPDAATQRPAASLTDYGDDELLSELAWRLRGRT